MKDWHLIMQSIDHIALKEKKKISFCFEELYLNLKKSETFIEIRRSSLIEED